MRVFYGRVVTGGAFLQKAFFTGLIFYKARFFTRCAFLYRANFFQRAFFIENLFFQSAAAFPDHFFVLLSSVLFSRLMFYLIVAIKRCTKA